MGSKTMMASLCLLAVTVHAEGLDRLTGDATQDASHLGQMARRLAFAQDIDGSRASLKRYAEAKAALPDALAFAEAFRRRYPGEAARPVAQILAAEQGLPATGRAAAARFAQHAASQAAQAEGLSGAARDVIWRQAATTCETVLWLDPAEPECAKIGARAASQAAASARASRAALAQAKPPKERLRGKKHAPLRAKLGRAYAAAWRDTPRRVLLDGKPKRHTVRATGATHEDAPAWIIAADGDHCRAFHMTFRRTRPKAGRWGGWRSHSSGHTYPLLCP